MSRDLGFWYLLKDVHRIFLLVSGKKNSNNNNKCRKMKARSSAYALVAEVMTKDCILRNATHSFGGSLDNEAATRLCGCDVAPTGSSQIGARRRGRARLNPRPSAELGACYRGPRLFEQLNRRAMLEWKVTAALVVELDQLLELTAHSRVPTSQCSGFVY